MAFQSVATDQRSVLHEDMYTDIQYDTAPLFPNQRNFVCHHAG